MSNLLIHALIWVFIVPHWGYNLENAMETAKAENKMVLLNFSGSDWCGPCIMMQRNIFNTPEFESYAAEYLELVKADFPRKKDNQLLPEQSAYNAGLAEKFNPTGKFPLTLLISSEGEVVYVWEGYNKKLSVDVFIATLKDNVLF